MSTSQAITIHRTYQMRGYTNRTGYGRIRVVLRICQQLYNRALAERKAIYRLTGKTMNLYSQTKWLTALREGAQELSQIDAQVERGVLRRLGRAYKNFFDRIDEYKTIAARKRAEGKPSRRDGAMPGFPRFKPRQRYTCIELAQVTPSMVKGTHIKVKGLPVIRIRPNRPLPECTPKSLRIVLRGRILEVSLTYAEEAHPLPANDSAVGIDLGVNERMTLSTGETVERRETDSARQRVLQRAYARKKKGSNRRAKAVAKYARWARKQQVANRNECHEITTDLVRNYGRIAIEALEINNMARAGSGLAREVLGQTWGILRQQLAYKVEWTGRELVEVDPRYTSRICSECGEVQPKPRVYRIFECRDCGHVEDRDVNAAKNILHRGWGIPAQGIT